MLIKPKHIFGFPLKQDIINPQAVEILYRHNIDIFNIFSDIRNLCKINDIFLTIVSPDNATYFSTRPSVYTNLIHEELYNHDATMSPDFYKNFSFAWWEDAFNPEKHEILSFSKLIANKYSLGFSIVREIDGFHLIYSFATKERFKNMKSFYISNLDDLLKIGDYCYKKIRPIYAKYCIKHTPPKIKNFISFLELKKPPITSKPILLFNNEAI